MLSDTQIRYALLRDTLRIEPFHHSRLQAASLDVTLDTALWVLRSDGGPLDPRRDMTEEFEPDIVSAIDGFTLMPGMFALGSTVEKFSFSRKLMGKLEGKSSLGRLGLVVHSTAGFLDPGFCGQVTLELSVSHGRGVVLYPGMPIGQVAFDEVRNVARPYEGKYVGQEGPTLSRYHQNWDEDQLAWR